MRVLVRGVLGAILLAAAGTGGVGAAPEVHVVLGLVHDSNLFEAVRDPQGGWVNRLHVSSSGYLVNRNRGHLRVRHQGGIKRFWVTARDVAGGAGDVVANHLVTSGRVRVSPRIDLSGSGFLKLKQVTRVPGEESYLRGVADAGLAAALGKGLTGSIHYRIGADDARDASLPEVSLRELGLEVRLRRSRRLTGRAGVVWRWLDYDRPALQIGLGGQILVMPHSQSDLLREITAGLLVYRGMLVQLTYSFLDNRSNSSGYGFRGHRFQAMVVRHLFGGVDGQVYVNLQARDYEDLPFSFPGTASEADEYEQSIIILKMSRQVTGPWGASLQYGFFRNGARQAGGFYRKHVYTFSVDTSL